MKYCTTLLGKQMEKPSKQSYQITRDLRIFFGYDYRAKRRAAQSAPPALSVPKQFNLIQREGGTVQRRKASSVRIRRLRLYTDHAAGLNVQPALGRIA
jgi:hypothetical protein